ncbi:nb-arc and ankyrin-like protein [Alternaria alternata]|nr:nb-arc and ankyrin-like protein [Alternaria alternata]
MASVLPRMVAAKLRYLFLVERAHVLRAPYAPRYKDVLWLLSTIAIVVLLGAICIASFVSPKYVLSDVDGRCHVGLQRYAAIPLLACDIVINLYLTTVFIYLLSPLVEDNTKSGTGVVKRVTLRISKTFGRVQQKATMDLHRSNKALVKRVEILLRKTLIGCVLVILPTGGNLAALCILVGKQLAFVSPDLDNLNEGSRSNILFLDLLHYMHFRWYVRCYQPLDPADANMTVTWAAIVFHWLTIVGTDENEGATPA